MWTSGTSAIVGINDMEERNPLLIGTVIGNRDYRDMDRSVTLFTRERGKVAFVARGVRKITSKNRGSTDLFVEGEYLLSRSKAYYVLSQGKVLESYLSIRKDLTRSAVAMTMTLFLNDVLVENVPAKEIYELFSWCLHRLETSKDPLFLLRYFLVKALLYLGHKPNLDGCMICGATSGDFRYSFTDGCLTCSQCTQEGFYIENELLDLYIKLEKDDLAGLAGINYGKVRLDKFDFFLEKLIEEIIERRWTGFDYLRKLIFED